MIIIIIIIIRILKVGITKSLELYAVYPKTYEYPLYIHTHMNQINATFNDLKQTCTVTRIKLKHQCISKCLLLNVIILMILIFWMYESYLMSDFYPSHMGLYG